VKLGRSTVLVCTNSASLAIFSVSLDSIEDPRLKTLLGTGNGSRFVGENEVEDEGIALVDGLSSG
jgi:hypothetical protein